MIPELLCATHGHHVIFHQTFLNWTQEFHHQGSDHSSNWEDGIFYKCLASPCLCFPAPALLRLHVSCPRSPAGLVATASSVSNVPETKQSSLTESVMSDRLRPGHNKMMGGGSVINVFTDIQPHHTRNFSKNIYQMMIFTDNFKIFWSWVLRATTNLY